MKKGKEKTPAETEATVEIYDLEGNMTQKVSFLKECDIEKFLKSCCFGIFYKILRNGEVVDSGRIEGGGGRERVEGEGGGRVSGVSGVRSFWRGNFRDI
ncbi:MAG: hypothetical protein K9H49_07440 [Bacteroidales bacterium]|nr:hypothetical protein [Bacteroidales bacterium]MCF8391998.1 hypothetical protein [Bacteroidales bacterium]